MIGILKRLIKGLSGNRPIDYDQTKALARHADAKVRLDLAVLTDVKPEILYFLADDSLPEVRRAVAANTATPRPADLLLALALVHHLAISNNVPLARIASYLARLGRELVIEFVPKQDSQVQRLLSTREDVFPDYTREGFEAAFTRYWRIREKRDVSGSLRSLYRMSRIQA